MAGGEPDAINPVTKLPKNHKILKALRGIEDQVEFVGPKSQEELALLFNSATATIVPSFYESFGMVAAEAQACGSPVIASNVGGLKNVVQDGVTGLLVETKNAVDLAVAMEVLSINHLLSQKLSRQAVEVAKKDFHWPSISERVMKMYEVVSSEKRNTSIGNRFGWNIGR